MGVVYLATQHTPRRPVALKVIHEKYAHDPERIERFRREANAAGRLTHRGIARIHAVGSENDVSYLAMEYVEGKTLGETLEEVWQRRGARKAQDHSSGVRGIAERARLIGYLINAADAIDFANEHGVIHRDLKPDNIMITPEGDVKVLDFGLAKLEDYDTFTQAGAVLGTPVYLSPEQILGADAADHRTDIHALGVILYELLTGSPPWTAPEKEAIYRQILTEDPPAPGSAVPRDLATIMREALEKKPERRPNSVMIICNQHPLARHHSIALFLNHR